MGKIIKKFIKVMSFGGTILENYHSQEEPLSTMIERLSESGAGGEEERLRLPRYFRLEKKERFCRWEKKTTKWAEREHFA